jgi:hypothetical protein
MTIRIVLTRRVPLADTGAYLTVHLPKRHDVYRLAELFERLRRADHWRQRLEAELEQEADEERRGALEGRVAQARAEIDDLRERCLAQVTQYVVGWDGLRPDAVERRYRIRFDLPDGMTEIPFSQEVLSALMEYSDPFCTDLIVALTEAAVGRPQAVEDAAKNS